MLIKVRVLPKSKQNKVIQKSEDGFIIETKEKPEQGSANTKVKELLASFLKISENNIRLIKGSKTRNKIYKINKQ
ncbi:MAG: hypothetical protein COV29_03760 [Candidatus Yanofskybacteria bacterium CG10_big_fil_rev_8_21_14_0_10_36_16]|uniref:Uncharacterized protein n=1 Tax=Candidatus Yanofskybacteria bacterium CG10_big_fil_rev_8_21_14_0_10_36_16 TaxID=1975096 RepID=A0A2J0Q6L1_9BACT|nr:MAG: hypothetical protein COV29_03760 [Candidatus Yanofskybacteria bacterium CG10_big_fil_rev_8_21_14_0_10_36_16]